MQKYNPQKKTGVSETLQAKSTSPGSNVVHLQDNRQEVVQQARTKSIPKRIPPKKKKTISGHGKLRREDPNLIKPFTIPKGKSVMRPAPPGATLGDLSMLLNENNKLSREELLELMEVSTTEHIWKNKKVAELVRGNSEIVKSKIQEEALDKLLSDQKLSIEEQKSLEELEGQKDFEQWGDTYVRSETFRTFVGGDTMHDMVFTSFENNLRSNNPHEENEYIEDETNLSDYVGNNPGIDHFVVNACSDDSESPYAGFQIDQKKNN